MTDIMDFIAENALLAFFGVVGMTIMIVIIASSSGDIGGTSGVLRAIIPVAWGMLVVWLLVKGIDRFKQ